MPNVICNTSPLKYLYQAGLLNLLHDIYSHVLIPQTVVAEIDAGKRKNINLPDLENLSWATIKSPEKRSTASLLSQATNLGIGEKHVISLGMETPDALLIMDDLFARRYASKAGIEVTGTAGVLIAAKQQGLLASIKPSLDHILDLGFYLSEHLYHQCLELADENIDFNPRR